jgi:hypothetical protein
MRAIEALVLVLGLAFPLVSASAASAGTLTCVRVVSGSTGRAVCRGTGNWRLAVYCDFPSVSPVYSGTMWGDGTASATCWFGAHAQRAAIEEW